MISLRDLLPQGIPGPEAPAFHRRGPADRLAGVLTWQDVATLLETSCFDGPGSAAIGEALDLPACLSRVRLVKDGRQAWRVPRRVDAPEFVRRLAGTTLSIEAIEEIHPPLRRLAQDLQAEAPASYLNAYAAYGTSAGLALHYDYTPVLVLQLAGEKHWSVYRPTREAVRGPESRAYKDALQRAERGESDDCTELRRVYDGLFFEGTLQAGDMLFMPAGWFHKAQPTGCPTLHLTCAFHAPPGRCMEALRVVMPDALCAANA